MENGVLYIVGTPIGNLKDMTYRAVETLKNVDFIAAEDTRVSIKLLNHYNIKNNLISFHEHSKEAKLREIVNRLLIGQNCALVSDAGMPCISDPGEKLVKLARENNIKVTVVPGASAAIAGLVISGLNTSQFVFIGFLSVNKKNRLKMLESLKNERRTMIFYEAPHKLKNTINDLLTTFGNRKISIVKELTKIYEKVWTTNLNEAKEYYNFVDKIRGEFVLVLEGSDKEVEEMTIDKGILMVKQLHDEKEMSVSEAIKVVSQKTGLKKNMLYKKINHEF